MITRILTASSGKATPNSECMTCAAQILSGATNRLAKGAGTTPRRRREFCRASPGKGGGKEEGRRGRGKIWGGGKKGGGGGGAPPAGNGGGGGAGGKAPQPRAGGPGPPPGGEKNPGNKRRG